MSKSRKRQRRKTYKGHTMSDARLVASARSEASRARRRRTVVGSDEPCDCPPVAVVVVLECGNMVPADFTVDTEP